MIVVEAKPLGYNIPKGFKKFRSVPWENYTFIQSSFANLGEL